jgi:hypothetical protein
MKPASITHLWKTPGTQARHGFQEILKYVIANLQTDLFTRNRVINLRVNVNHEKKSS